MGATAQHGPEIGGEGTHIGALAALHPDHEAVTVAAETFKSMDLYMTRLAGNLDPGPSVLVERLPVMLEGRIHGRNLLDITP